MGRILKIPIDGRVFTKDDIRMLAQVLWQLYEEAKRTSKEDGGIRVKYSIAFEDDSTFSGGYRDVFADGEWIDLKRANEIRMYFEDRTSNREVDLIIVAGNGRRSSLTVEGPDQEWAGGIARHLQTIIESAKPQPIWVSRYVAYNVPFIIGVAVSYWVGRVGTRLLIMLLNSVGWHKAGYRMQEIAAENTVDTAMAIFVLGIICIMPVAFFLATLLYKLWPSIEFNFGPEHMRMEGQRRRKIGWFIAFIVIPIVTGVVTDLITR